MSSTLSSINLQFTNTGIELSIQPSGSDLLIDRSINITSTTNSISSTTGALMIKSNSLSPTGGSLICNGNMVFTGGNNKPFFHTGSIYNNTPNYYVICSGTSQSIPSLTTTEVAAYFTGGQSFSSGSIITNPSLGRLQVSEAGAYLYNSCIMWSATLGGTVESWVVISGSSSGSNPKIAWSSLNYNNSTVGRCSLLSCLLELNTNDYVSTFVYNRNGAPRSVAGSISSLQTSLYKIQ